MGSCPSSTADLLRTSSLLDFGFLLHKTDNILWRHSGNYFGVLWSKSLYTYKFSIISASQNATKTANKSHVPSGLTVPMNQSPRGNHSAWPWLHKTLHVTPWGAVWAGERWLTSAFKQVAEVWIWISDNDTACRSHYDLKWGCIQLC